MRNALGVAKLQVKKLIPCVGNVGVGAAKLQSSSAKDPRSLDTEEDWSKLWATSLRVGWQGGEPFLV